jgi:hypothetical protein
MLTPPIFASLQNTQPQLETSQTSSSGDRLQVSYVSAQVLSDDCRNGHHIIEVMIRILLWILHHRPYHDVGEPAIGATSVTILVSSVQQTLQFANVPLTAGSAQGEYFAKIQIHQDNPGRVNIFVQKNSLTIKEASGSGVAAIETLSGPEIPVSSDQTDDTSDVSSFNIVSCTAPGTQQASQPLQNYTVLLAFAAIVAFSIATVFAILRRRKPS